VEVSDVRIEHRYCTRRKSLDSRFDSDRPLHYIHARVRISEVPNRNLWDAHPHRHSLVSLGFVAFVLFGFVSFLNAWNAGSSTQQYEDQPYHESEFQVVRAYWQPHRKGGPDVFACGNVEGRQDLMSLVPYLHLVPRSEAELDSLVPPRTRIPVYLFPGLTGRARVQALSDLRPPRPAGARRSTRSRILCWDWL
jgi:hypothetical protein